VKLLAWRSRSNAAQVAGLGRVYFALSLASDFRDHARIGKDQSKSLRNFYKLIERVTLNGLKAVKDRAWSVTNAKPAHITIDYSLFILLY
jgi:hypothetical protein